MQTCIGIRTALDRKAVVIEVGLAPYQEPQFTYILGCPPAQDSSHHQDCYVFSDPNLNYKPSFATIASWEGGTTQPITWLQVSTS